MIRSSHLLLQGQFLGLILSLNFLCTAASNAASNAGVSATSLSQLPYQLKMLGPSWSSLNGENLSPYDQRMTGSRAGSYRFPKSPLELFYRWLNERPLLPSQQLIAGLDFSDYLPDFPIERFRKYDPAADRSFIRFGRNPSSLDSLPFNANSLSRALNSMSSAGRLNRWWNESPFLQSKRPSPGEIVKDTSFIRFGKRMAPEPSAFEPQF